MRTTWRARMAAFALATGAVLAAQDAEAWWSASASGPLLLERYSVCSDPNDPRCVGPAFGRRALLDNLTIDPRTFKDDETKVSRFRDAAHVAAAFAVTDAIPLLRVALDLQVAPDERATHMAITKNAIRAEAADTLAFLGDAHSTSKIEALVREFETDGHGSLWRDTLNALGRLDVPRAGHYAAEFFGRQALRDFGWSMPGGSSREEALHWVVAARDKSALPALRKITTPTDGVTTSLSGSWCKLTAARISLGEEPFTSEAKKLLTANTSGTWAATCDSAWLSAIPVMEKDVGLFGRWLGRSDAGMDYGTANVAYRRLLETLVLFAERHRQGQKATVVENGAKAEIKKMLGERSRWPHVADPTHRHYSRHWVGMHQAALASLGDADAAKKLWAVVDDQADTSGAAFVGAFWAVSLGLPEAMDHAAALLARGTRFENQERSGLYANIREHLVDAMLAQAPNDHRWVVALADAEWSVREHAIILVARRPKAIAAACDAVAAVAPDATQRGVEDAFFTLGSFNACEARFDRIAKDLNAAAKVRGMAFEMLGAMGSPTVLQLADEAMTQKDMRPYVERAKAMSRARR